MKQFEDVSLEENAVEVVLENASEACECEIACELQEVEIPEENEPTCQEMEEQISCRAEKEEGREVISEKEANEKEVKKGKHSSSPYSAFLSEYEKAEGAEAKLQLSINFMECALAQTGSPHFKSFWDARNLCLQLFKEPISQSLRGEAWTKYIELSKEARRLKEILDEQSSFAAEQIEIAIVALEADLKEIETEADEKTSAFDGIKAESFADKYSFYEEVQNKLNSLNTQASRINSLRKELIKTEMRIKVKNKFFQRLSLIGDKIFPQRKELIKNLSDDFLADIDAFIETHFNSNFQNEQLFFLREEIKALQGLAKVLTLNTHAFTHTRMRLSECWDKLKGIEKERKKERAQQKIFYKENEEAALAKIHSFKERFAAGEIAASEGQAALSEISLFMRNIELGREEVRFLKEELSLARAALLQKLQAEEEERVKEEKEREAEKRKIFEDLKVEVEQLFENSSTLDVDAINQERNIILEKTNNTKLAKFEKNELEKRLKGLRDIINDKKDEALMALSDDDKQALNQLVAVLNQRKERRQEIKLQLDALKKTSGSSGFDFEQAMKNNELISEEKERLLKMDVAVKEIEALIEDLKKKVT